MRQTTKMLSQSLSISLIACVSLLLVACASGHSAQPDAAGDAGSGQVPQSTASTPATTPQPGAPSTPADADVPADTNAPANQSTPVAPADPEAEPDPIPTQPSGQADVD